MSSGATQGSTSPHSEQPLAERPFPNSVEQLQRQLEEAQRLAGLGSWFWDLTTGDVAWSRETYRIFGVAPDVQPSFELVLGMSVDEARQREFLDLIRSALRGERDYDFELLVRLADGREATLHTRGAVERASDGTPLRMVGTVQDVTRARAAEAALREREARFRTLAESSPAGVYQTEPNGQVVYANQRLLTWFDMDFATFSSGAWASRIHPDDAGIVSEEWLRSREQLEPFDREYRIVIRDQVRWLRVRAEAILDADGNVLGHIGSVLDTSAERHAAEERARLQAQLQHSRRLESIGLLAGGVAHDFNNLLVGILANASLAREEMPIGHTSREALDDIAHAAQRAAELTRQLLAYAGRARLERRQVSLAPLVEELPRVLGARIPAHVTISVDPPALPGEFLTVDGDETQLRQVVLNLITNAVDAIGEQPGRVQVSLGVRRLSGTDLHRCLLGRDREPGRYVIIEVKDSGVGMSQDVQERMFDPFFTTKASGRGLGLAATLGILNSHGGIIHVSSAAGVGTTMCVALPLSRNRVTPTQPRVVPETLVEGSGLILLVDDDASARAAARRILRRAGYDVVEAENGADALVCFEQLPTPPRCIVLDVSMPIMNGDECLRTLRSRGHQVPALLSSGYDADDVASHLIDPGHVHFLQKPYTARALLSAVAELTGTA
jgi:two-component system, cell cycle sensor histidine kinase and response regulator CckA